MQRMIDTGTWDDPWFADLEPDAKLLFLYFLTNRRSTAAGAFEITLRAMSFETGLSQDRIVAILDTLHPRVQWWADLHIIWVRNFFKHQAANDNFRKSAMGYIAGLPVDVQVAIAEVYPNLVDPNVSAAKNRTETGTDTHTEPMPTGTDTPPVVKSSREKKSRGGADAPAPDPSEADGALRVLPGADPTPDLPAVQGNNPEHRLVNEYYRIMGGKPTNVGRALGNAKKLAEQHVYPGDLPSLIEWARQSRLGRDGFDLGTLVVGLDQWRSWKAERSRKANARSGLVFG